ncbi:MAG: YbhB/YbcL family Raf kinase inhibitor-like protein [Thermoproteota archaeon]|jgi:Raf kinase inhibitor-like YbhB/YbcL family protein|nr:MAG: YbhB/YbcL family Raf kinase inhibitor-like protein [Candidatus Korarchaeota archaeon]
MQRSALLVLILLVLAVILAVVILFPRPEERKAVPNISINVDFSIKNTCDGQDISPRISWSGVPNNTKSLALIVEDPDAPGGLFVHWVIYNIDPSLKGLPEGIPKTEVVSGIGLQGVNSFGKIGYGGPCPPRGSTHRYIFRIYALKETVQLGPGASRNDLLRAMEGKIIAVGETTVNYGR